MQYRQLGRSGLKVSPLCLGTMMFGGPTSEVDSAKIIAKAREAGINFIDTADAYSKGGSEEVIGRAIANNRHAWVLATKLANPMGNDPNRVGLSRRWVLQAERGTLLVPTRSTAPSAADENPGGFVPVALGGLGNNRGAIICGLLLGLYQQAANFLVGGVFVSVAVFTIFIAALLIAPQGLFGASKERRV